MSILGDIDPTPEYDKIVVPITFTDVWCQNIKKHPLIRHPTLHTPTRMRPIECKKLEDGSYFCPECKEVVEVDPPMIASWGPVESRAGYPKSMIGKM